MPLGNIIVSVKYDCIVADKEVLDVFTSFNDSSIELVAVRPPSIVIVGGQCSSRVAVANRLLGRDVLPAPRCNAAWHTLQFVDTDCVRSFNVDNAAAVNSLWSWFNTVPLVDIELNSVQKTLRGAAVESECVPTVPVVNILMSHPLLRAGGQVVVYGDHSCISTVQFAVDDVIPIIIFVVSAVQLSDKVCAAVVITSVGRRLCVTMSYIWYRSQFVNEQVKITEIRNLMLLNSVLNDM